MAMLMTEPKAPPNPGDTWVCVTANSQGIPVKVLRVTPLNVQFRVFGSRGSRDEDRINSLAIDAFMVRYEPMNRVKTRQKELRRMERDQRPQKPEEPAPAPMTPVSAPVAPVEARKVNRGHAGVSPCQKITAELAREIAILARDWMPHAEIAAAYGMSKSNVSRIWTGSIWPGATADIRAMPRPPKPQAAPAAPPPPTPPAPTAVAAPEPPEETPVPVVDGQITTGHVLPPKRFEPRPATTGIMNPLHVDATPVSRRVNPDPLAALQIESDAWQSASRQLGAEMHEMADALEVLVEYAGKPLPKFVKLDFPAIRGLIERARGQTP